MEVGTKILMATTDPVKEATDQEMGQAIMNRPKDGTGNGPGGGTGNCDGTGPKGSKRGGRK